MSQSPPIEAAPIAPPPPTLPKRSRFLWFAGGLATGIAVTLLLTCITSAVIVSAARGKATARTGHQPDRAEAAALVKLVAKPLKVVGQPEPPTPSEAQVRAALFTRGQDALVFVERGGPLGPIGNDYYAALQSLQTILDQPPSMEPLVNAGYNGLQASVNKDDRAVFLAFLEAGNELRKLGAYGDRIRPVHTAVVACRLRAAQTLASVSPVESAGLKIDHRFVETGFTGGAAQDALLLTNNSGRTLTDVAVSTQLIGNGDQFVNTYFIASWPSGQTVSAPCQSEEPARETVHRVQLVRYRVMAAEQTGQVVEIKVR